MIKKLFLVFFIAAAAAGAHSAEDEFPFSRREFEVEIYQYPHMLLVDSGDTYEVYAFTNQDNDFELYYSFFTQTETDVENIRRSFALFAISMINNRAGYEVDLNEIELYNDEDVAETFNGDIGVSTFIPDPYGSEYAFMLMSLFYKKDQGVVIQKIFFNDIEFAGTDEFAQISHSFKFSE